MRSHNNLLSTNICPVGKKSIRQFRELWGSGKYEVGEGGWEREIPICCYWPSPQKQRPAVSGTINSAKPLKVKYSNGPSFHGLSGFFLSFIAYSTTTTMCLLQLLHCKDKILNWDNRVLTYTFLIPRIWQLQMRAQRRKKIRWELSSMFIGCSADLLCL